MEEEAVNPLIRGGTTYKCVEGANSYRTYNIVQTHGMHCVIILYACMRMVV